MALNGSLFVGKISRGQAAVATQTLACPVPKLASPETLFRSNYARLVRSLAVAFGDSEAAADAVQEAFIQLCLHWKSVSEHADPAAWVRRKAIRRLGSSHPTNGHHATVLLRGWRRAPESDPPRAFRADLEAALRRLSLPQRVALALHYVEDLSVSEIARSMDISEEDARTYLQEARDALEPNLKPLSWAETIIY